MMQASATQVGPGRFAARLHVNNVCVYNNPRFADEASALLDAQDEIGRRAEAVREAERLERAQAAREATIPLLRRLAAANANDIDDLLATARRLIADIEPATLQAAE